MSTVFDVTGVNVDSNGPVAVINDVESVVITDATSTPSVTVDAPNTVSQVNVEVPGMQGPPGVQNVYVQSTNPAALYGWGMAEKDFIWIDTA